MSRFEPLGPSLIHTGEVREMYALPDGDVLMVATDNISALDHILSVPIPGKGVVFTQLSLWWLERPCDLAPDHVVFVDISDVVRGHSVVVEKLDMVPVECVARGYLTGSGWAEYQWSWTVCGVPLLDGLCDDDKLPTPIFIPAIRAQLGEHDENVNLATIARPHGDELAARLRDLTPEVYARAGWIAARRSITLTDTKLEFGRCDDGTLALTDEVLTPDSSRLWDVELWRPGELLSSFDRQYVRDWLAEQSGQDREMTPPELPAEVVEATRARYAEAYERLTGRSSWEILAV